MAAKSAVIGIDLGTSDSYVAFVGKGVIDVVQNEVSKRATPTLVGFTDRERLLGDSALAQIKSNAKNTCRNFKHLLGRSLEAPDLTREAFWSTSPLVTTGEGLAGYEVSYKGEPRQFSAVQCLAMYFTKLREVSEKWSQAKVAEAVVSVPSYFSDTQRQAVLDSADIAGLHVSGLMNETAATALAYGIYRSNDFDREKPATVAFCSMGHALFSVSIVQFVRGKLEVLCERCELVGGRDMDECLMREFAGQFKKKVGADPLSNKKASFKLEDAVTKTKKILSANSEAPISVECLMEDEDFAGNITRADFEKMCEPAMAKAKAVLDAVIAASPVPVEKVDSVEMVGGASRVPWVKRMCSEAFGGRELSTTLNQEESVARGCALQAATLSPLFKVREFATHALSAFDINMAASEGEGKEEGKMTTVFPAGSTMNVLKMLTFYRSGTFDVKVEYADAQHLLPLTPKELGIFRVELPAQDAPKRVKVRAKLSSSGTFCIEGAQMVENEEYEETVKEKRELPPEPAQPDGEEQEGAEAAEGKPAAEKRYEWVEVVQKKTRVKRTDLVISASRTPGLARAAIEVHQGEEKAMQEEMREIQETDERRNDLESYIFSMRDKIAEGGTYGPFIAPAERETFTAALTAAEDWLYDSHDASKALYISKLEELKGMGEPVAWRCRESGMRDEWFNAVMETLKNYRAAAQEPGDKFGHVPSEKLAKVTAACDDLERWLRENKAKQDALPKSEKPVLLCVDMERRSQELAKMADAILRESKAPAKSAAKKEEAAAKKEEAAAKKEEAAAKKEEAAAKTEQQKPEEGVQPEACGG